MSHPRIVPSLSDFSETLRYIIDLKRQGHHQLALDQIREARLAGHEDVNLDVSEADCLARLRDPKRALAVLENRLSLQELPEYGQALLAGLLETAERHEEAAPIFDTLAGQPNLTPPVARRVLAHLEKRDLPRAVNLARRLPPNGDNLLQLAKLLIKSELPDEARSVLREGHKRFPEHQMLAREWVMTGLEGLPEEEQIEELRLMLTLAEYRSNIQIKERLIQLCRKHGRLEEARDLLLDCLRQEPRNLYLKSNLGYVHSKLGEIDKALDIFEEVMDEKITDTHVESAYFATCREHDRKQRAADYVASRAGADPRRRRLYGLLKSRLR